MSQYVSLRLRKLPNLHWTIMPDMEIEPPQDLVVTTQHGCEIARAVRIVDSKPAGLKGESDPFIIEILRPVNEDDRNKILELKAKEREAFLQARDKIQHHQLSMKLLKAEYLYDYSRLILYFKSENKVDFRDLLKSLASQFKTRIELRQIGVQVNIEVLDKGTHQQRQIDGDYDLNFFRYTYDSAIQVLKILYHSDTMPPNGANWAFYSNPQADEHFVNFRSATTPEERSAAIMGVQQVLLEDVAMVPIYSPLGIWAMRTWVQGFVPNPQAIYPLHNDMWVTEDSPRAE